MCFSSLPSTFLSSVLLDKLGNVLSFPATHEKELGDYTHTAFLLVLNPVARYSIFHVSHFCFPERGARNVQVLTAGIQ